MKLRQINKAQLHWYSKEKITPGRKLGHLTIPLMDTNPKERFKKA